jgi:bacterioferritin
MDLTRNCDGVCLLAALKPTMPLMSKENFMIGTMTAKETDCLNRILELELAGVVRYTHYALMVFGFSRIPIIEWLRKQARESLMHADHAGELITSLGEDPALTIGPLLKMHTHDVAAIMGEALEHEIAALKAYEELLATVKGENVLLEEYARKMICEEQTHCSEIWKMLRICNDVHATGPVMDWK